MQRMYVKEGYVKKKESVIDKNKGERKRGENRKLGVGKRELGEGGMNMIKIHCITVSKINESIVLEKK